MKRRSPLDRARWWWTFHTLTGSDVGLNGSDGRIFLEFHARRRFKRCILVEVTPDELQALADQIQDLLNDTPEETL